MINDTNFHVCEGCGAEFSVELTYDEYEEMTVQYCPVCGTSLTEEEEPEGFEDRYDENE